MLLMQLWLLLVLRRQQDSSNGDSLFLWLTTPLQMFDARAVVDPFMFRALSAAYFDN
jgi:hypothetical protein